MAKDKSRDRTRSGKKIPASEENFELTMADIERTGELPDRETMDSRHPGASNQKNPRRKEFMLSAVHSLRMRNYTYDQIAAALHLSPKAIRWYASEMQKYLEQDVSFITFRGYLGNSLVVYKDLQAKALRMFAGEPQKQMSDQNKLRALRDTAFFERGKLTVMKEAGFFKNAKLNPAPSGSTEDLKPIDVMKRLLNSLVVDPKTAKKVKPDTLENATFDPDKDARVLF